MDADDVVPAYFVLADEAAARIRAALRERADGTIRLIQTRRTTRFRFLGKLAALYDFDRTNIYPCDAHLPHYVPLLEEGERYFDCSETDAGLATLYRQQYCVFRLVYLCKPDELFCGRPVAQFAGCWAQRGCGAAAQGCPRPSRRRHLLCRGAGKGPLKAHGERAGKAAPAQ